MYRKLISTCKAGAEKLPPPLCCVLRTLFLLVFWLFVWQVAAVWIDQPLFLPRPAAVGGAFLRLVRTGVIWRTAGASLLRIFGGYLLGVLAGCLFAVLFTVIRPLRTLFSPIFTVIRSTPVASFIMLLWLLFGNKSLPIAIGFLMVLPLIYQNLTAGIDALPRELYEVCRLYRLPLQRRITAFYYPSLMPYFAPAAVSALGLAWKAGVAAEVLANTPLSIGKEISLAKAYLEIENLYAWTAVVILLSLFFELLLKAFVRKFSRRETRNG